MALKAMLPDNSAIWREIRPTSKRQMRYRLIQLKGSLNNYVTKHSWRRSRQSQNTTVPTGLGTAISTLSTLNRPERDTSTAENFPLDEILPAGIPSYCKYPALYSLYSENRTSVSKEKLGCLMEAPWSDKEVEPSAHPTNRIVAIERGVASDAIHSTNQAKELGRSQMELPLTTSDPVDSSILRLS